MASVFYLEEQLSTGEWRPFRAAKSLDDATKAAVTHTLSSAIKGEPGKGWRAAEYVRKEARVASIFVNGESFGEHEIVPLTVLPEGGALAAFLREEA